MVNKIIFPKYFSIQTTSLCNGHCIFCPYDEIKNLFSKKIMDDSLSIVLPIFNEEANISNVVSGIFSNIHNYVRDFEVLVINDGSTDKTLEVLNGLKMSYPELKIVSYQRNRGYGSAIKTGIKFSQKQWVFIMDSDGQYRIDDFEKFWNIRQSYDFILGCRKRRNDNLYRIILAKFGNFISNLLLGRKIRDINCGFKLFWREDLVRIPISSTGGIISFEILYNLFKNNKNKFLQLSVQHYERKAGRQTGGRLKVIIRMILEGIRIVLGLNH